MGNHGMATKSRKLSGPAPQPVKFTPAVVRKPKSGMPHVALKFSAGGKQYRFCLDLGVTDETESMATSIALEPECAGPGTYQLDADRSRWFSVGKKPEGGETQASVSAVSRAMRQLFTMFVAGHQIDAEFSHEITRAARMAVDSWRSTALSILAERMLEVGSVEQAVEALNLEVAREVVSS